MKKFKPNAYEVFLVLLVLLLLAIVLLGSPGDAQTFRPRLESSARVCEVVTIRVDGLQSVDLRSGTAKVMPLQVPALSVCYSGQRDPNLTVQPVRKKRKVTLEGSETAIQLILDGPD
jgi:hypothetical protein